MKPRLKWFIGIGIIVATIGVISYQGLRQMTVFFYTPQEVLAAPHQFQKKVIRIGALVQPGSVVWDPARIQLSFQITEDSQHMIPVVYQGVKPDMFREGQGVVVEGILTGNQFQAHQLLVKHSEEYKVDTKAHQKNKAEYYQSLIQGS